MNVTAISETAHNYDEYRGELIRPVGFEGLLTVLEVQPFSEPVEFEGTMRDAYHLVSMKVSCCRTDAAINAP